MSKQNCQPLFTCQRFTISIGEITLYLIIEADNILHLSFSKSHHLRARKTLMEEGINVVDDRGNPPAWLLTPLKQYVEGLSRDLPFKVSNHFLDRGTSFQKKVWNQISAIPNGSTKTYGDLASLAGSPKASRAVGQACNVNPLALIIPCHRVVGKHSLGGFAGGIKTKKLLLKRETGY